ncbi:hypothetical protein ABW19_dt0202564 [Dactylella cylindrospora]|nr:hypothetical protein ABW19_dt0202564 [Dactylella cylindrospora]
MLSNYEVLAHIQDVKRKYKEEFSERGPAGAMKSGNLETVMKELTDYLSTTTVASQSSEKTTRLVEALAKFQLEKIEVLMILNHQPKNETELDVLVEELETRFTEEQIQEILENVDNILGTPGGAEPAND